MIVRVWCLLVLLLFPVVAHAATYYVRKDGNNTNPGTADTPSGAWVTIGKCASTIVAGDICIVADSGTYDERVTESTDGTSLNRITFQAASGATPVVRGFGLTGDYITLQGLEITSAGMTADAAINIDIGSNTGTKLIDLNVHDTQADIGVRCSNADFLEIIDTDISYVYVSNAPEYGVAIKSGTAGNPCDDVLIAGGTLSFVGDYLIGHGTRYVMRNVTIGPAEPTMFRHVDGVQNDALLTAVLIEGVVTVDNDSSDNHFFLNQVNLSDHWIVRHNTICRSKGGFDWSNVDYLRFYHNSIVNTTSTNNFQLYLHDAAINNRARNNIWYDATDGGADNPYFIGDTSTIDKDYDLWFDNGDPAETNDINADPLFVNRAGCNFALDAGSPAIDAGGPLTTVDAVDTGSGTSLMLTDARMFQPGWAGTTADGIAVGTAGNITAITAINYATGEVTIAPPITRNDNEPVWLYSNSSGTRVLYGTAPDIGAREYQAPTGGTRIRRSGEQ